MCAAVHFAAALEVWVGFLRASGGDDEEFLREVLADLRTEVEAQLSIIAEIINVSENEICRAIK